MANFFTDNADLVFQYEHGLRWDELVAATEFDFSLPGGPKDAKEARSFYDEVCKLTGDLAANKIAPVAAAIDRESARLKDGVVKNPKAVDDIVAAFAEAGFFGMTVPRELGGSNCPLAVYFTCTEVIARADVSMLTHLGFFGGTATALLAYSLFEGSVKPGKGGSIFAGTTRFDQEIREIASGKNWGCMVLTEPDCGSDLGAIRTKATLRDGKWYLNGNKIFITSGHAEYQIVLARSEPASGSGALDGLKGLSLFFCRQHKQRDGQLIPNVRIDKVEHKLGHNASATCSLVYEDSEAELIGERGQGFELMLLMMNGARIAVGFEAIGLCQAALTQASEYADVRRTMGKPIAEHELIAEMLMDMDTSVRGMRALAFECINHQELAHKYELLMRYVPAKKTAELERIVSRAKRRARELTPLLKYVGGEKAVEIARANMQIHGGSGYMVEVGAEKLMRDALAVPVYEGTSQIQALMALKDQITFVLRDPTRFARRMSAASLGATTAKTALERQLHQGRLEVYRALTHLIGRIAGKKLRKDLSSALRSVPAQDWPRYLMSDFMREWDLRVDFSYGLLHAERLTKMLVDTEIGHVLCKQGAAHPERRIYAERHVRRMLPRLRYLSDEIRSGDNSVFDWLHERAQRGAS